MNPLFPIVQYPTFSLEKDTPSQNFAYLDFTLNSAQIKKLPRPPSNPVNVVLKSPGGPRGSFVIWDLNSRYPTSPLR